MTGMEMVQATVLWVDMHPVVLWMCAGSAIGALFTVVYWLVGVFRPRVAAARVAAKRWIGQRRAARHGLPLRDYRPLPTTGMSGPMPQRADHPNPCACDPCQTAWAECRDLAERWHQPAVEPAHESIGYHLRRHGRAAVRAAHNLTARRTR